MIDIIKCVCLQELGKEDSVPNETDPIHLSSEKPSFVQENKTGVKEIKDVKKRVKNLVQNLIKNGHCKVRVKAFLVIFVNFDLMLFCFSKRLQAQIPFNLNPFNLEKLK